MSSVGCSGGGPKRRPPHSRYTRVRRFPTSLTPASPAGGEIERRGMENGTHQELLRGTNDRIYNVLWGVGGEEGNFLCECGGTDCTEHVELLSIEYAARRGQAILAPGHTQLPPTVS